MKHLNIWHLLDAICLAAVLASILTLSLLAQSRDAPVVAVPPPGSVTVAGR